MKSYLSLTDKLKSIGSTFKDLEITDKNNKTFISGEVKEIEVYFVRNNIRLPFTMKTEDGAKITWSIPHVTTGAYSKWKITISTPENPDPIFFRSAPLEIQRKYRTALYNFVDKFETYLKSLQEAVNFSRE